MILNNSHGKDKEIRRLLSKSMLNMDPVTISTWMKYKYDPNGMFCILEDQKIVACLQTKERTLHYEGKKCKALILSLACTLPDYRQRHYFSQLMEAAMNYANCNHMLTLCYTNFAKILEAKSFQNVSKTKYYWLEMENWSQGDLKNVRTYRPEMNLFSIYTEFMKHFDGSILLNKNEFDEQIHYYINCNHRIVTSLFVEELRPDTLHCAGRLDIDTTGLLIVTDDGELIHEITHPKKEITKLYRAVTDKPIPEKAVSAFLKGIKHPEEKFPYKSAKLTIESANVGLVEVKEGRFHEVKRLFECVGCEVIELTRLRIGSLELDDSLEEGEYRLLSDDEVDLLFAKVTD